MKINYHCLPCLVNQAVTVAELTNAPNREILFQTIFQHLGQMDFTKTNPEIIGMTFRLLKEHLHNRDPYWEVRRYYNDLFLKLSDEFDSKIKHSANPLEMAIKYAIVGNIIDFSPVHSLS